MKLFSIMIFLLISITVGHCLPVQTLPEHVKNFEVNVLLAYENEEEDQILNAYKSVLDEEGVSYALISMDKLYTRSPIKVASEVSAIIFPDGVIAYMPDDAGSWIEKYVKIGGNTAFIYDAGTKDKQDNYRIKSNYLDIVLGLDMVTYNNIEEKTYNMGNIVFKNKSTVDFFEIPPGKIDENNTLSGYQYGKLNYPILKRKIMDTSKGEVFASDQDGNPLIILKKIRKGSLLYVNTPLGYLKGQSDDLLLRSILKTFLFKVAHVPHIVSSPNAIGVLVINWHIDSSIEYTSLPWVLEHNYFRSDLVQSLHITAGPDLDVEGDKLGFNAIGEGRELLEKIMSYGKIGSHGGWRHNWFAKNIQENYLSKDKMKKYIKMNNEALESIVGYKITEYSAPVGVFPPKMSVEIMEELGLKAFYYLGDTGSAPNRTFFDGNMLSKNIIAFPVMTFGKNVSMYEFNMSQWSEEKVEKIYLDLVDYVIKNRAIRLYYGHPYDIRDYPYKVSTKTFLDYVSKMQKEKKLQTRTMTDIANFVLRIANAEKKFVFEKDKLHVEIKNDKGLKDLVLAVPKEILGRKVKKRGFEEDEYYYYIRLKRDTNARVRVTNKRVIDFTFEEV